MAPNGEGDIYLDADTVRVGDSNADVTITSNGTGDLTLNTNEGTDSGSIVIGAGAHNNITLAPDGVGHVVISGQEFPHQSSSTHSVLRADPSNGELNWAPDHLSHGAHRLVFNFNGVGGVGLACTV